MLVFVENKKEKQKVKVFKQKDRKKAEKYIRDLEKEGKKYKIIIRDRGNDKFEFAIHIEVDNN